jgi:hypothetical protein
MIWLWGLWKSSLILRIGAGITAIWAVWAGTYYMGQRKGASDREREIVDASKRSRRNDAMKTFVKFAVLSLVLGLGTGCAKNTVQLIETQSLCQDWQVYRPRKGDKLTDKSAEQLLENNEARVVWGCERLDNTAAS